MKKLFSFFILFVALTAIACKQPTGSNQPGSESQETVTPGWYFYTTNADSANPQKTYLYINTSGAIERAGSSEYEYTGSQLEMIQGQLSYIICKKNADGTVITFVSCESPSWGTVNNEPNTPSTCPYAEGEYLDVTQYSAFSWPVNKNLQLWSAKESSYTCSCSDIYGYINIGNIFVVGESLSAGDYVTITMEDTDGEIHTCDVYFTAASSSNNDNSDDNNNSGNSWGIGYEWWCFEKAYTGNLDCFVLYDNDGNPVKAGTNNNEETNSLYLAINKTQAIQNFNGTCYQITDYTQLPSWCFE